MQIEESIVTEIRAKLEPTGYFSSLAAFIPWCYGAADEFFEFCDDCYCAATQLTESNY